MGKAIIFDFDGVLVDSEAHWPEANMRLMNGILNGYAWTLEDNWKITGHSMHGVHDMLTREYGLTLDLDAFSARVWGNASDIYESLSTLMPGAFELLRRAEGAGIPLAVASSNERRMIDIAMKRLGIDGFFDAIRSKDDVAHGRTKPHPDVYLLAAEALGMRPEDCVAVEDSPTGIAAAKAAGMHCIALKSAFNGMHDLSSADAHVAHFDELSDDALASLLA